MVLPAGVRILIQVPILVLLQKQANVLRKTENGAPTQLALADGVLKQKEIVQ